MKFKLILTFIIIFLIGFFVWQGIYLPKNLGSVENTMFSIEKGQKLFQIGENLEKEGIIKNKFFFDFYLIMKGNQKKLQAGKYFLSSSENILNIAKKIISGSTAKIKITIPEGFTIKQIEERFKEIGYPISPIDVSLEGFLFPDTYQFSYSETNQEIIQKMMDNFDKKLTSDLREEIEKQNKTILEIITMASLLEKELITKEEKELASGVLWKRLNTKMPLQVDCFLETYEKLGLPEKPICNPGLESIIAAVYPKDNLYWYYLSTPEGETIFSKTLKEHNLLKAEYY